MANYNRGKNFKKNSKKNSRSAYVKNKVDVINSMSFMNDEPLESFDDISNTVKVSLADKRTYMIFTNLDQSKVSVYYHFLMGALMKNHEQEKLTRVSALTWISEYLDVLNSPPRELKDNLDEVLGIFEAVL